MTIPEIEGERASPGSTKLTGRVDAHLLRARHKRVRIALIRARESQEKSRPQFAREIGSSRHFVFNVEMGSRNPSIATMQKWLAALGPGASMDLFAKQGD